MDKTTYPGSETDNNDLTYDHCEFQSTTSNDFVNQWVNFTVEKDVLRGTKLREEKLKSYPQLLECDVVNIDLVKSPCIEETPFHRKSPPARRKGNTTPCSPRSNSPIPRHNPSRYTSQAMCTRPNTPSLKMKCVQRCPMRIAELAVPTKRQCFDTWRNKCDVLPACMVERLRQQVMDEKPVVQISEAISCFQRKRPKSLKSINKRSKKGNRETKLKIDRNEEIRKLCAAFADKIARKLITPRNLNLNPELDKLSKIVANEITKIIQNRKKHNINNNTHRRIHADISDKIAVWIATILEDSSYKLLEEDLKVKQHSEREIKEDRIITLMGKFYQGKSSELEEEEGPVLDFIDNLVNNVVTICEPEVINMEDESETTSKAASEELDDRSIESPDSTENNEFDTSTLYTNITYDTGDGTVMKSSEIEPLGSKTQISAIQEIDNQSFDNDVSEGIELNINDHIREEIDKIIDSFTADNIMDNNEENALDESAFVKDELQNSTDSTREFITQSPGNSELVGSNQVRSVEDIPPVAEADSNSNVKDEMEDNKSNDISELSAEESSDDKNKKVKFSEIDMGLLGPDGTLNEDSTKQTTGDEQMAWKASTDSFKHDIVLAPPNEHLLSDADESWPENISPIALKPSASVNRSITSLGKILEKDEKLQQSEDEIRSQLGGDASQKKELAQMDQSEDKVITQKELPEIINVNNGLTENKDKLKASKIDSKDKYHHYGAGEIKSTTILEYTKKQSSENDALDKKVDGTEALSNLEASHNFVNSTTVNETGQSDLITVESTSNLIYEAIQQKIKSPYALPEPKFDYKVHPKTAPSWLRHDNGKGEPSEDSFRDGCTTKAKFKESDIRSWCKDLDRICVNMEMWNGWVDTTCKNVLHLKQKREMNKLFAPNLKRKDAKEWANLKKNIDKDTVLWTKLNQRTFERLKCYKDKAKYHMVEKTEMLHVKSNRTNDEARVDAETIMKAMENIDRICLWMHRTIVSTEYCMACDCKNNPRRKL